MCDRDKLMKLCDQKIENMHFVNSDHWFDFSQKIEELVDYLISNGVTVTNVGCKSEWISVDERLPEDVYGRDRKQITVLVCTKSGRVSTSSRVRMMQISRDTWELEYTDIFEWSGQIAKKVTHWMPLPEAPKGGAE